ncbi:cytochrome P450 [Helicostylum pulchrum]|nr:cytochrome P450 [Helicostylum pulchrum]
MDQVNKLGGYLPVSSLERKDLFPVVSIAAAASIFFASYQFFSSGQNNKQEYKKIPTPGSRYPYVGHMYSLGAVPGSTIRKWHNELGPIFNLKMGIRNWFMVDDPVLAQKIFVTNGAKTSFRAHHVFSVDHYSMGGMGLAFSQPDERWKVSRSAALTVLAPKHIEKYIWTMRQEAKDLVTRFIQSTERKGSVDPSQSLKLFALNVMFKIICGKRFDSITHPDYKQFQKIVEHNIKNAAWESDTSNFIPIFSVYEYFFGTLADQKNFIKIERDPFFRRIIKDATITEGPNVIKSFVEDEFNLSEDEILVLTSDLILAGLDTVSVSLAWNMAVMCHHPDIQKKLAAEIDDFIKVNGHLPDLKEKGKLPYCICVIKESLRFKQTAPLGLAHTTREDIYIDGYMFPKNSSIISSMESMHMRPELYPDPEKFNPERFMGNTKPMQSAANGRLEDRDHYNFGWGRRICPGIAMAEAQLFVALVEIFSRCYVEPTSDGLPDIDNAIHGGLTARPVNYKVKFVQRTDFST